MDDNLIGYLLNSLDKTTHREVEAYLKSSAEAQRKLDLLRQALAPLAQDKADPVPPSNLVIRTLGRVAEHCTRQLPRSPRQAPRPRPVHRPLWRRADVLVAASLLLAVVSLSVPAVSKLRQHQARVECQNNLKEFFFGLQTYHDQHGKLPNFADQTNNVAGMIAPLLHDAGVLPQTASIRCPANGPPVPCTATVEQFQGLSPEEFQKQAPRLIPCYAYSLGYRDEGGIYHFPNDPEGVPANLVPLMADRPPQQAGQANSPNHGGLGQNVLFHDGHVRFATVRTVGINGDDIYLNRAMQVAAGLNRFDTVLGHSAARPFDPFQGQNPAQP